MAGDLILHQQIEINGLKAEIARLRKALEAAEQNLGDACEMRDRMARARDDWMSEAQEALCRAERAEAALEALWADCKIVYWPGDGTYPIEHIASIGKNMRAVIEAALSSSEGAATEPQETPNG